MIFRRPPDTIPFDQQAGVIVPNGLIEEGADGVEKRRGEPVNSQTYLGAIEPTNLARHLDVTAVMQIGIFKILDKTIMHRHNMEELVLNDSLESSSFAWNRICFDMPRIGEQELPLPMAVILTESKCVYDHSDFQSTLLEDTIDAYGENTVLRRTSNAKQTLTIHALSAHHEERRAIKKMFETTFLAEPNDDEVGRKVVIPQYYDRTVRISFVDCDYPETAPGTHANKHEVVATFECTCDVVLLVKRPGLIEKPITNLQVEP